MSRVFEATYGGSWCPECGDEIKKGDEVSYLTGGELLHAECNVESDWDEYYNQE